MIGRLSRNKKYFGTFMTRGENTEGYIIWETTNNFRPGFVVRDLNDVLLTSKSCSGIGDLRDQGIMFKQNGKVELKKETELAAV